VAASPPRPPSEPPADRAARRAAELHTRSRAARRAGRIAAGVAAGLAIGKLVAGIVGHSSAVTASAVDSLVDVVASAANSVAIYLSHEAPDRDHPFGHAKIEPVAIAAQGLLIGGSGVYLLVEGILRLIEPQALRYPPVTLGAMGVAALVTTALVVYLGRAATKTASMAIRADALHYRTDLVANIAVLLGVAATYATGVLQIDGGLTVGVGVYLLSSAIGLLKSGVRDLVDTGASAARVAKLERLFVELRERGSIQGHHRLRTRVAGRTLFVDVHIELPDDMPLREAHNIGDRVRDAVLDVEPDAEVLIHVDVDRDD
jgi:ferrous-iron efflux pump FieF